MRDARQPSAGWSLYRALGWVVLAGLAASSAATAGDDSHRPKLTFNGYATLGLVHSSEDRADFLGSFLLERGAGFTADWSAEVDSRVGAQLTATFGPQLSAVVQLVAEQQADGEYTPHLEWANLKYQVSPDFSLRLGRVVLPSFMVSDFRKVGYANAWVRPPVEVYALIPISSSDGLDASYRVSFGDYADTLQGNVGRSETDLPDGGTARARSLWGLTNLLERGPASFRLAYQQADLSIDSYNTLFDAFRQFGPPGEAIAERFDSDGAVFQFLGAGALYDPGKWFATAEWGSIRTHSAVGDRTAWFASGGYRLGEVTLYLTHSQVRPDSETSDPGLSLVGLPPELAGIAAGLNAALNGLLGGNPDQSTLSLGARWDFRENLDLKIQYDRNRLGRGSAGNLGNVQPSFRPGGRYELISVAVDVVF
ncbi:MAG: porin [Thermoanaerobaculia bacterium]